MATATGNPLKDLISKLDAKTATSTLHNLADMIDGNKDGTFSAADLQSRMNSEVQKAATDALSNPWRVVKEVAIAGTISFLLGGGLSLLFFCHRCAS